MSSEIPGDAHAAGPEVTGSEAKGSLCRKLAGGAPKSAGEM